MIHLDTNYLIGLVTAHSPLQPILFEWLNTGEKLAVSTIAWSEFLNGPVTRQQVHEASAILEARIVVFGIFEAEMSARIFNQTGRKRQRQIDCFIAATAICARVPLATDNQKHFLPFVAGGLQLA
ncbi:MAG: type II toxin-antitoxin system VapC family toxin [Methylacidiphilales bacterium]|nr:type II toxin-antitoxin system VapC family toxin [Candidatus Methylacidiphilales bacterium]